MKSIMLKAVIENIPSATAFIDEQLEALGCSMKAQMQIDVAIDGLVSSLCLNVFQCLTTLKGNRCRDAGNLHHVQLAVTMGNKLGCGIADASDVDGEDGHTA